MNALRRNYKLVLYFTSAYLYRTGMILYGAPMFLYAVVRSCTCVYGAR